MSFQSSINIFSAVGFPGNFSFDGPIRSKAANINSNGASPNVMGYAYTWTANSNPDTAGGSMNGAIAQVGGTGVFAGILVNPKEQTSLGTTGNVLGATLTIPDNTVGELCDMGEIWVNLPGTANVGDIVTFDTTTGALNSIPPVVSFTGYIVPGGSAGVNDVLHVSAVSQGQLSVGMLVNGAGVAGGTYISSFGTAHGDTGTYNLSSINEQTVGSSGAQITMTGPNAPAPAWSASSAYISGTTMTITTLTSGELVVGSQVLGVGVLPNTVITAFGSGVGGTGTYTVNNSQTVFSSGTPGTLTGNTQAIVPHATVGIFGAASGVASIKLTN